MKKHLTFLAILIFFSIIVSAGATSPVSSTITTNWNKVPKDDTLWMAGVFKTQGSVVEGQQFYITNIQVSFPFSGSTQTVNLPNSLITFSASYSSPSTTYDPGSNTWITNVPLSTAGTNVFLGGGGWPLPSNGISSNISGNQVSMTANFISTGATSIQWQWAAAAYNTFSTDNNALGVQAADGVTSNHGGTPNNYANSSYVDQGGSGGGSSNYTGSYSSTAAVSVPAGSFTLYTTHTVSAWVRQTDIASGTVIDITIPGTSGGSFTAAWPATSSGDEFQLYATGTAWDNSVYLLDTKFVNTYNPQSVVAMNTEDSYVRGDPNSGNYVCRTRADRPYTVNHTISGCSTTSSDPAKTSITCTHSYCSADPTTYSYAGCQQTQVSSQTYTNGSYSCGSLHTCIPANSTGVTRSPCGAETFCYTRQATTGIPAATLAQPTVEIWPVASASVSNITAGAVYTDALPSCTINMYNLYPDSYNYVQIYSGTSSPGKNGTIVAGSETRYGLYYNPTQVVTPTNVPQNATYTFTSLSNYTPKDGVYTMEVCNQTPFFNRAREVLYSVTFTVNRVITSYGSINSAEKASGGGN